MKAQLVSPPVFIYLVKTLWTDTKEGGLAGENPFDEKIVIRPQIKCLNNVEASSTFFLLYCGGKDVNK